MKRVAVLATLICIAAYIAFTHILPYAIIQPGRKLIGIAPETVSSTFEKINISLKEGGSLRGYIFHPVETKPKAIVILVHGIGGAKEHFFPLASKLKEQGISSVAIDNRAHGESDGEYVSYGYFEKYDVQKIVSKLKVEYPDTPIGIWGSSMGGAIGLQAMEIDSRIEFGIIESTFTNLSQIVYDYQKRYSLGLGLRFATDYSLKKAGEIASFNPVDVSSLNAVKNISQPIFMAHGDNDKRIAYSYGEALFKNLASKEKYFELVKGAGHLDVGKVGGKTYYKKIIAFIENQLN